MSLTIGYPVMYGMYVSCRFMNCGRTACSNTPIDLATTKLYGAQIMDDSDNSTTLPFVTRRKMLAGTTAATAMWPFGHGSGAAGALAGDAGCDPVLALWHAWKTARRDTVALCRKQQGLETQLINTVGFPRAEVRLPGEDGTITVWWHGEIGDYFGGDCAFSDIRVRAEADLAAHQARWDAEDERIGYSATVRAERAAADREQELVDALMATPATSLAGVAAKLDAVLREGNIWEDGTEFPWPQIRSALDDLARMGRRPAAVARLSTASPGATG